MEQFSSMSSIFLDLQCYRVLAENKITIEVKINITIQYALLTPTSIKPHDEIPMLINFTGCLYFLALGPFLGPRPRPLALSPNLYLLALVPNLYLPALAPTLCLPTLAPNLFLLALAPNLHLPALAPNLYLPTLAPTLCLPQICIYRLSPMPEFAYTDLVSPICIYWPWPTICTHTGC